MCPFVAGNPVARRILYVANSNMIGGGNRSLLTICGQLSGTGFRPHVVVPGHGPMAEELERLRVPYSLLGPAPGAQPGRLRLAWSALRFAALVSRIRPALIHVNAVPQFRVPGPVGRRLGIPTICHVRYYATPDSARYFLKWPPDALVFNSRHMQEAFPAFPGRTGKTPLERVIYNGFDRDAYWAPPERDSVRESWGCGDRLVVGMLGNLSPAKGHESFLDIARRLLERGNAMHFVIVGADILEGGRREAALREQARAMGLSARVSFAGFEPRVARPLAGFDLLAVPSREEPFGRVAVEGLLAGLPVVASHVGGLPEILEGVAGARLAAPDDVPAFVAAIEELSGPLHSGGRPYTSNVEVANRRFGNPHVFMEVMTLYRDLLADAPRPAKPFPETTVS